MSDGLHGHGTSLSINAIVIGNIVSISGPDQSRDSIDISTMDSTDKWREFTTGMLDAGEITFDLNYDGAAVGTANDLNTAFTAVASTILVTLPDTSSFSASGFITALGTAIPFDDKVSQSVTVKLTGAMTFTDVAA